MDKKYLLIVMGVLIASSMYGGSAIPDDITCEPDPITGIFVWCSDNNLFGSYDAAENYYIEHAPVREWINKATTTPAIFTVTGGPTENY